MQDNSQEGECAQPDKQKGFFGMYQDLVRSFLRDEDGATAIEYALIAGIVSISIVAALSQVSTTLQGTFSSIASSLAPAS